MNQLKDSLVERLARERARAIVDKGTFQELLGPFDGVESPHLPKQGIVPQSDDGVVVAKGAIDGEPAIVIAIEGNFQGGGIGEVSGAKIAGALELALRDHKKGIKIQPVIIFDTGGVRLQEANYGLLSIAEIGSAIVALRKHVPVVGIIPGKIGSFGGMSINAGLLSSIIMTKEGRIGLNGPEVVELEAGIDEIDSSERQQIWRTIGGEQRFAIGFADFLVDDDLGEIKACLYQIFKSGVQPARSSKVETYQHFLSQIDPLSKISPKEAQTIWRERHTVRKERADSLQVESIISRGKDWFQKLTNQTEMNAQVPSVLCADSETAQGRVRYLTVAPNPNSRFYRARNGEVGLEEGWQLAKYIHEAMEEDQFQDKRAIVAIVDVPSQAYGYHEELFGIHQACAAAVDAYASARMAGHPVITLIVGKAISGAFLAHGLQANRILAFDDEQVNVHVMSKQSAAKITRRTITELEEATSKVPAMAYDIRSFTTLGAIDELITGIDPDQPTDEEILAIQEKIEKYIKDLKEGEVSLCHRLKTKAATTGGRAASILVRKKLSEQWN